ncbi:restriction endonuclease subunit S [Leptospira kirschneri]|uniref:restriction endonuclease subunit S n=1 Tax=Leptospira kirschneri TaxID=29507 RepID=UPI0002D33A00|nr:restriction endonuclease subunit S [Leptospira kirschneri]KON77207.1 Type I restriction modification DNA specificity domain protein [Leptospira kirschneri serovar Mozdok]KPZ76938.1 restriction endonuclease subunit S [Leptospira kirschneri serovar Mozdok]NDK05210.1 Type I restriction enzyme, S subunit [Leptospira kirschneri serovar Mozdok]
MSQRSFLDQLLDGAKVEWKALGEIFDLRNGYTPSKSNSEYWEDGTIPWFRMEDIRENGQILNDALQKVATNALKGGKLFPANSIIVATSATIGEHALITVPYLSNQRFTNLILKSEHSDRFEIKFLFYYCFLLDDWCKNNTTVSSFASVDMNGFRKFQIPIPPLPVQAEIVRILDAFTELTAELTARKKQYNYYRDQLLSFEEGEVEWKTLGEVAEKISSGGTPNTNVAEYWENGTIPWMSSGEVNLETVYKTEKYISEAGLKNSSAKFVPKNSIVIALAGQGKTRGKVARIRVDLTTNQSLASLTFNENQINPDFVFHFLKTQYDNLRQISSGSGTRGGLNLQMISSYKLPIPSLAEQKRIVAILDKFDALTSSISEGLPREIELRQKQYEYYRELLLSFPKPDGTK